MRPRLPERLFDLLFDFDLHVDFDLLFEFDLLLLPDLLLLLLPDLLFDFDLLFDLLFDFDLLLDLLPDLLLLPEPLPQERRSRFTWAKANPAGSLRLLRSHPELLGLAGASFLGMFAHYVLPSTMVLYAMYRYGWDERDVGLALAAVGVSSIIVQGGLVHFAVRRFGERRAALTGLACGSLGFLAYGLAPNGALFLAAIPLLALWGLYSPSAMALMTRRVEATDQGKLQGANASLNGIAGMIAPAVFTWTFAAFIAPASGVHWPGTPFVLAAVLLVAAWVAAERATRGD